MNTEDQNVSAKILSDIKLIRESFTRPMMDTARSMSDTAQRIATGVYLVTQHLSDKVSIKMSLRNSADDLISVVYKTSDEQSQSDTYAVLTVADRIMSFVTIARISGSISDINGLLIEREVLKISRLVSMMLVRGEGDFAQNMMRDRSDVRLKMIDLFDYSEVDVRKTKPKMSDKISRPDPVISHTQSAQIARGETSVKGHDELSPLKSESNDQSIVSNTESQPGRDSGLEHEVLTIDEVNEYPNGSSNQNEADISNTDTKAPSIESTTRDGVVQSARASEPSQTTRQSIGNSTHNGQYVTPSQSNTMSSVTRTVAPTHSAPRNQSQNNGQLSSTELRRQQILRFIRETGIVSIKEIAEGVTGVSDKTLQRALIDLVNDKVVVRHGDRRWSRYEAVM